MGSRGSFVQLVLQLVLVVLCNSGNSLQCYSCVDPVSTCTSKMTCSPNFDACLLAKSAPRKYHQCWKLADCTFDRVSQILGDNKIQYNCCQRDLCNTEASDNESGIGSGGTTLSGKIVLLVIPFLAAAWRHL
ncbi:CD59 glycoprotein [Cynocephalus volans]|uniref:CD59 glycoprotein n=1 Tax=Cynocephalus volans TaxID=110931 RepID=UPI002FCB9835